MAGDFNGRVGVKNEESIDVLGRFGEVDRNSNGKRIIEFCLLNNLVVGNSFFQHKQIHQITRWERSRKESSIIDYVLVEAGDLKTVKDIHVRRSAEIGSDHFLQVATINIGRKIITKAVKEKLRSVIDIQKLKLKNCKRRYQERIREGIEAKKHQLETDNVEIVWQLFKEICLKAAEEVCGRKVLSNIRKQTSWWSEEIRLEVKTKKALWKKYLASKSEDAYEEYKLQRNRVKKSIKLEKTKSWEEFGKKMEADYKGNQKLFFRVLKNMRKTQKQTATSIRNSDGKLATKEAEIMEIWLEHFKSVLEGEQVVEERVVSSQSDTSEVDDDIDFNEVKKAVEACKSGKSPGDDGIGVEMLKALGEDGLKLLHKIVNTAWNSKKIPRDWEIAVIIPIFKKGDPTICNNYRGISLLSVTSKIYERILEKKLRMELEGKIDDSQHGVPGGKRYSGPNFLPATFSNQNIRA